VTKWYPEWTFTVHVHTIFTSSILTPLNIGLQLENSPIIRLTNFDTLMEMAGSRQNLQNLQASKISTASLLGRREAFSRSVEHLTSTNHSPPRRPKPTKLASLMPTYRPKSTLAATITHAGDRSNNELFEPRVLGAFGQVPIEVPTTFTPEIEMMLDAIQSQVLAHPNQPLPVHFNSSLCYIIEAFHNIKAESAKASNHKGLGMARTQTQLSDEERPQHDWSARKKPQSRISDLEQRSAHQVRRVDSATQSQVSASASRSKREYALEPVSPDAYFPMTNEYFPIAPVSNTHELPRNFPLDKIDGHVAGEHVRTTAPRPAHPSDANVALRSFISDRDKSMTENRRLSRIPRASPRQEYLSSTQPRREGSSSSTRTAFRDPHG
jgi:hypothetical protein